MWKSECFGEFCEVLQSLESSKFFSGTIFSNTPTHFADPYKLQIDMKVHLHCRECIVHRKLWFVCTGSPPVIQSIKESQDHKEIATVDPGTVSVEVARPEDDPRRAWSRWTHHSSKAQVSFTRRSISDKLVDIHQRCHRCWHTQIWSKAMSFPHPHTQSCWHNCFFWVNS